MRFKIHYDDGIEEDNIIVSGDTIEDIKAKGAVELRRRGWSEDDCWSEEIK